ncbi:hypothetical protein [Methylorubrum extorquens]|uniref:Uncharacterized protein n=1 Tax=Methylorubrum extorquens (strain CM4 / NCIMB 13688) TaxID=440085 RepID=B7KRR2_METC4|nr:hypothetical protein [Methylorubrum extorquens]ACK85589.1 conserved hypothetical protein [Methylorubrum extorquens CM4]
MAPDLYDDHCPVPLTTLGALYRADEFVLSDLLDTIPEETRARLALYLYGRSHTHALGIKVAATCDGEALRDASGVVGSILYDLSRQPLTKRGDGNSSKMSISLAGSRASSRSINPVAH